MIQGGGLINLSYCGLQGVSHLVMVSGGQRREFAGKEESYGETGKYVTWSLSSMYAKYTQCFCRSFCLWFGNDVRMCNSGVTP